MLSSSSRVNLPHLSDNSFAVNQTAATRKKQDLTKDKLRSKEQENQLHFSGNGERRRPLESC
jgi:hypothetical protein